MLKKKTPDALASVRHYCLFLKDMCRKHTAYHIFNSNPGHTCPKQQVEKYLKITFASPSKSTDEKKKRKEKKKDHFKAYWMTHKRKKKKKKKKEKGNCKEFCVTRKRKKTYHRFGLFRIKWILINTSYNILKLFISRESEFNFDIRKNILFSRHLLRKHGRFLCPSDTK